MTFQEAYAKHADEEFLEFDRVKTKLSRRNDLHAFILLDGLCPGKDDMVAAAEHDEIWLGVDVDDLDKVATEDQMVELIRAGVRYNRQTNSLALYV